MKILYVSDSPTLSGAEVVLLGELDHFRATGAECAVYLPSSNTRLVAELERRGVAAVTSSSYSRVLLESTLNPRSLAHFARAFWKVGREIGRVVREREIDLLHSISYPTSLYAAFPARRSRVAHLWHEHNIKRIHRVNRHLYRFAAATCAWVAGPSDAVTRNLARAGIPQRKLRTVYNGIDLGRFRLDAAAAGRVRHELGMAPGDHGVGLFGQMLPHKGHATLVDAAPALLERFPGTRFFFVGALENPPYQDALRARLRAHGLESRFTFTGWRRDVQDVIQAMDAVVVATTTQEPAALALMETMAMGRPIVASRTGGTPEIVRDGETGLLFEPGDSPGLADRLARILADRGFAAGLGRAGRAVVEREFSLERHLREMEGLYASIHDLGLSSRR
jgi:glycosyltransferase involved in cell wall biosynthesis